MLLFMAYFAWGRTIIWMIIYDAEAFLKRKEKLYFFFYIFLKKDFVFPGSCMLFEMFYDTILIEISFG